MSLELTIYKNNLIIYCKYLFPYLNIIFSFSPRLFSANLFQNQVVFYNLGYNDFYVGVTGTINEALPGVLGNSGTRAIFSGEQGNKCLKIRETVEHRQFWGTGNIEGNIENQDFVFGEQGHFFRGEQGNRYLPPPPPPF